MAATHPGSFSYDTQTVGPPAAYRDNNPTSIGGYDAVAPKGRRRSPAAAITREDSLLKGGRRTRLQTGSQDLQRNYAIAGWMVRRHLDYVAQFSFHGRNATRHKYTAASDEQLAQLDRDLERLMEEDSTRQRFDIGRRFRREKFFRIAEMQRTVAGDVGILKLNDGRVQGIEGDLIRDPQESDLRRNFQGNGKRTEWVDGFRVGRGGVTLAAAIHSRGTGGHGYELSRIVSTRNLIHHGYFSRFADSQTRGVSPIASAITDLQDTREAKDYTLARMKVDQLFAMAVYRDAEESMGEIGEDGGDDDDGESNGKKYNVDFGLGPVFLDLDPGDRAEFLSSSNPSAQAQSFMSTVIAIALKSLDIPFSFYDESHTNFFGSRAAWLHYERSCFDKRCDQIEMRTEYTVFKIITWIRDGRLTLPAGMTVADVLFEWVPRGMPWWDPAKEIRGDKEAISAGLDNPERICKRTGNGDVEENLRATARTIKAAEDIGKEIIGRPIVLDFGAWQIAPDDDDEKAKDK